MTLTCMVEIKRYKGSILIFVDGKAHAEKVKRIVSGNGKVAVWVWAPGPILNNVVSLDHIKDLTGINIKKMKIAKQIFMST